MAVPVAAKLGQSFCSGTWHPRTPRAWSVHVACLRGWAVCVGLSRWSSRAAHAAASSARASRVASGAPTAEGPAGDRRGRRPHTNSGTRSRARSYGLAPDAAIASRPATAAGPTANHARAFLSSFLSSARVPLQVAPLVPSPPWATAARRISRWTAARSDRRRPPYSSRRTNRP